MYNTIGPLQSNFGHDNHQSTEGCDRQADNAGIQITHYMKNSIMVQAATPHMECTSHAVHQKITFICSDVHARRKKVLHQLQSNEQATTPNNWKFNKTTQFLERLRWHSLGQEQYKDDFLVHLLTDYAFTSFGFQFTAKYLCLGNAEAPSTGVACYLQDDISQAAIYSKKSRHKTGLYNKLKGGIEASGFLTQREMYNVQKGNGNV